MRRTTQVNLSSVGGKCVQSETKKKCDLGYFGNVFREIILVNVQKQKTNYS